MASLIGLEIEIGNQKRFVGKIGSCPDDSQVPQFKNVRMLYKEELWSKAFSYVTNSLGIDSDAYEESKRQGSKGMCIYIKDRKELYLVSNAKIDGCRSSDLGEGVEVRVPLHKFRVVDNAHSLNFGYTRNVITVHRSQKSFEQALNIEQKEIF